MIGTMPYTGSVDVAVKRFRKASTGDLIHDAIIKFQILNLDGTQVTGFIPMDYQGENGHYRGSVVVSLNPGSLYKLVVVCENYPATWEQVVRAVKRGFGTE